MKKWYTITKQFYLGNKERSKLEIKYCSTRDKTNIVSPSMAILQGLAADGGLYVPQEFPDFDLDIKKLSKMSYQEVAFEVMSKFLSDFTEEELKDCIKKAYDAKFDTLQIAPIKKVGANYYLELFHGSTIAFKDMALSILPHLMITAAKKQKSNQEIVILTATSGDTGKAAMAGFSDVPGTKIIVFYPKKGVSPIQERQMLTQKGKNTYVVGITGNFDDAQTNVKKMFNNASLNEKLAQENLKFSSANSINIGRLVPQIAYYVYAYAQLVAKNQIQLGEKINFSVPTGNFGNILAGYYAKKIGLPINQFICASNKNNVLTDFFRSGTYNKKRPFFITNSPSMDILVSSNLERLIYHLTGEDASKTKSFMNDLVIKGEYTISEEMKVKLAGFYANYASEEETAQEIQTVFSENAYVLDPHTAVAGKVYRYYQEETQDTTKTVIVSTASPYKFPRAVIEAILGKSLPKETDFELVEQLHQKAHLSIPTAVTEIMDAQILHNTVVHSDEMQQEVERILNLN